MFLGISIKKIIVDALLTLKQSNICQSDKILRQLLESISRFHFGKFKCFTAFGHLKILHDITCLSNASPIFLKAENLLHL